MKSVRREVQGSQKQSQKDKCRSPKVSVVQRTFKYSQVGNTDTRLAQWICRSWTCYFYTELICSSSNWSSTVSSLFWVHWSISEKTLVTAHGLGLFALCSPSELINWYSGCHFRSWLMAPVPLHPTHLLSLIYTVVFKQALWPAITIFVCLQIPHQKRNSMKKLLHYAPVNPKNLASSFPEGYSTNTYWMNEGPVHWTSFLKLQADHQPPDSGDITMPKPHVWQDLDFSPFCQANLSQTCYSIWFSG